jgi:CheY-like chemotaxis protein
MYGNGHRGLAIGRPITISLGASVRSRRLRLGISQEELAERSGLHRTYIAGIEGGGRNITLKSIEKLARGLETTVATLLIELEHSPAENKASLLLVEDDPKDLQLTLDVFRKARLTNEIHVARDGEEALDFLFSKGKYSSRRSEPVPQLALLDLDLPKIQGLEVLRRMKADKLTQMIHVVVLSASRKDENCREALRLGAVSCLIKPVDFQEFCRITPKLSLDWTLIQPRTAS